MLPADDEHSIQTLPTHAAYPALGDRIRARSSNRAPRNLDTDRREHRIERRGELRVAVTDEEPQAIHSVTEFHQQIPGPLHHPVRSRMSRHPHDAHPASVVFDDEQHIQPAQQHRVHMEEVHRQNSFGLGSEELLPRRPRSTRRRVHSPILEDLPHCRRRNRVSQPDEFAVDSPVTPQRVVPGHLQHQPADHHNSPWPPRPTPVRPPTSHQRRMPPQNRARRNDQPQPTPIRHKPHQHRRQRAISPRHTRLRHLTPKHSDLMTQHQDLRILSAI